MMHRHPSKVRWALGLSAMLALMGAGAAQADKLAFVDMQRALEGTTEGKAAKAKLQAEVDKKQKELEAKRDELKKLDEDLAKQASVLKPDVLEKKKQELQQKLMQWQEAAMRTQREIGEKEQKALEPIQRKIIMAINVIAQRDKFTAVLNHAAVLWPLQSEMDITNEVIRKANEAK